MGRKKKFTVDDDVLSLRGYGCEGGFQPSFGGDIIRLINVWFHLFGDR